MHVYKPPPVGGLDRVPVFTAGTGSTRADLFELDGVTPMPGNVLVADTGGNLPSFQCATSPVYVGTSGSRTTWTPSESGVPTTASGAPVAMANVPLVWYGMNAGATGIDTTSSFAPQLALQANGADVWGTPGSALPLGVTVAVDGFTLIYPDMPDGAMYDVAVQGGGTADVSDAGKLLKVWFETHGIFRQPTFDVPIRSDGSFSLSGTFFDVTFKGDVGATLIPIKILGATPALAHPIAVDSLDVFITQRVGP